MVAKTLSNNVYIQRSNNLHQVGQKDKKVLKKQSSSINSASSNSRPKPDSMAFKFVNLKKAKSPASNMTATGTLTEKESRSLKKNAK